MLHDIAVLYETFRERESSAVLNQTAASLLQSFRKMDLGVN